MSQDLSTLSAGSATISSLEIAELTGKEHNHVRRDIENMLFELKMDVSKFGHIYRDSKGRQQPCFMLPKRESLCLAAGYDVALRMSIIDRWSELEAQNAPAVPKTLREALLLSAQLLGEKEEAEARAIENLNAANEQKALVVLAKQEVQVKQGVIEKQAPKVKGFDRFVSQDGWITWQEASLALGLRANRLTELLKQRKALTDDLRPTHKLSRNCWHGKPILKAVESRDRNGRIRTKMFPTANGLTFFSEWLDTENLPERSPLPDIADEQEEIALVDLFKNLEDLS